MNYYFITLVISLFLFFFAEKNKKGSLPYKINIFLGTVILVLFAGFRSANVGTDTNNYIGIFREINKSKLTGIDTSLEYLFVILNKIALFISEDYISLLMCIAIITVCFNVKIITTFSYNLWLSLFIYITLGGYVFFFNGARQAMAVSIIGVAILQMYNKRFKWYIFWVVIAALFHKTAIVMLPLYFLNFNKFSLKKTVAIGGVFAVLIVFMSLLLSLVSDDIFNRYSVYEDRGAKGAYALTSFYILSTILLIHFKKSISRVYIKEYVFFLNLCVLHTIIYIVVQVLGVDVNIIRLASYLQIGFILIYPIVFKEVRMFRDLSTRLMFGLVHLIFYYIYLERMSDLVPYTFNPILNF